MSSELPQEGYKPKAFISCSLRKEDESFVNKIEQYLIGIGFEPFGTVGKYSASPTNVAQHMKENIPQADLMVVVATPRYIQEDIKTGESSLGLPPMLYVEAGMAVMADKPVIAFVKKGTEVGGFIRDITQYITLDETAENIESQGKLITKLFENAWKLIMSKKTKENTMEFKSLLIGALAIYGSYKLLQKIFRKN